MKQDKNPLDLNIELAGIDTSMPRLKPGNYLASIKEVKIEQNKAGTGQNMLVVFSTMEEAPSLTDDIIPAGWTLSKYYPLQQSENEKAPDFRRDICRLIDAAFNITDDSERPALTGQTLAQLVGQEVALKVRTRESEEYGIQNEISGVTAIAF